MYRKEVLTTNISTSWPEHVIYHCFRQRLGKTLSLFLCIQIQEFRTGATKQNMEVTHVREENKKLTKTISDLRGKLADLEARVSIHLTVYISFILSYLIETN